MILENQIPSSATGQEKTIGQEVAENYRKADVFKKYGIDFCCGGKKTLSKVCRDKNLNYEEIKRELNQTESSTGMPSLEVQTWDIGFLADYIVNTHHRYVKSALPVLSEYSAKIARVHGVEHPELVNIANLFTEAAEELTSHMLKEENVLFPYIKQLSASVTSGNARPFPAFGTVQNPINMMEHEHETVGEIFKTIRTLSDNYTPPADACNSYRVCFSKLEEFEQDLHRHIHLENNVLFPKSIEMEEVVAR